MRKILWIALVVLLLAILTPVVLIMTLPTARVAITVLGATGKTVTETNDAGEAVIGPEWRFGVTNVGRADAECYIWVETRAGGPPTGSAIAKVLKPREGMVMNRILPADDKAAWRGAVTYKALPTPMQDTLGRLGARTPGMRGFLPDWCRSGSSATVWHTTQTAWHTGTNTLPASAAVTNGS